MIVLLVWGTACKSSTQKQAEPKLAVMDTLEACQAFFQRVEHCAMMIAGEHASRQKVPRDQRDVFIKRELMQAKAELSRMDVVCQRSRELLSAHRSDMAACHAMEGCEAFASCYIDLESKIRAIRHAKTTEASESMKIIYDGAQNYYNKKPTPEENAETGEPAYFEYVPPPDHGGGSATELDNEVKPSTFERAPQ